MLRKHAQNRGRVLGIVVTYRPEPESLDGLLKALYPQVDEVIVVDNTPIGERGAWDVRRRNEPDPENVRYVFLAENMGIATALNVGLQCMIEEGFGYALLSDQDSTPEPDMVRNLLSVARRLRSAGKRVGSVCPQYVDCNTGILFPFQVMMPGKCFYSTIPSEQADPWLEIIINISSGSLLTRQAIASVGGMREELFMDHVDSEWCLRARAKNFKHFGTSTAQLSHRLGDGSFPIWVFGWRPFNLYSPQRLYYRFRNFILLCRLPHVPLRWAIRSAWHWLGVFYAFSIYAPNRLQNIKMMLLGIWHGMLGRSGKYFSR